MKLNVSLPQVHTHEGAVAQRVSPLDELKRTVLTCLLWEDSFYEKGSAIAERIEYLCTQVEPWEIARLVLKARNQMNLRHVPLFLMRQLAKRTRERYVIPDAPNATRTVGELVAATLPAVIQRVDELGEFLVMYQREGKDQPIAASVKRGLAAAFHNFNEYQFAKYDRDSAMKLRDVMFLVHPKPQGLAQEELFERIANRTLATPDTWEVELSAGKDKRETFERLLRERKLGGLAVLRNLRNMLQAGVSDELIRARLKGGIAKALPFRFVTAARYAPSLEDALEETMLQAVAGLPELPGTTGLLIDVSGSMNTFLSNKGETTRIDAAAGLAILLREKGERGVIATFSNDVVMVPPRRGFALRDAISQSQPHSATYLGRAVSTLSMSPMWQTVDRLIVITDEQAHDSVPAPWCPRAYMINVAPYQHGVGYGNGWTHINGWSERVLDYIQEIEKGE